MDRSSRTRRWLLIAVLTAMPAFCANPQAGDLDRWMKRSMAEFHVPGAALGVVKDGKLIYARGFGVRRLGEDAEVDEHTLFGIASNSKAFTAAAIGILATNGKLSLDDPVQKYLPAFQLFDPYVSREITVRDLLCHRSGLGLGAGDLLFWPDTDFTRNQVVAAVRFIRPESSFRSKYAYSNLMFVVAGQVVAAVSGMPWDDFIRTHIFQPIGMNESRITSVSFRAGGNFATPHSPGWRQRGDLKPVTLTRDDTWAAAAGVKSNVVDLARWVETQLRSGETEDGRRLWSPAVARRMWSPQTIITIHKPPAGLAATEPHFSAYGLGWTLRDYRGRKIVSHSGALTGMLTTVVMVPEEKLAVIVLTNQESAGMLNAVSYHVIDDCLHAPYTDWIREYAESHQQTLARAEDAERKQERERNAESRPSLPLTGYAGEYQDAWYGKSTLAVEKGHLVLRMTHTPAMVADLEPWQYDTFKAIWRDATIPDAFVTFILDYHGRVAEMKMAAVSSLADFSFDYQDLDFRPLRPKETN